MFQHRLWLLFADNSSASSFKTPTVSCFLQSFWIAESYADIPREDFACIWRHQWRKTVVFTRLCLSFPVAFFFQLSLHPCLRLPRSFRGSLKWVLLGIKPGVQFGVDCVAHVYSDKCILWQAQAKVSEGSTSCCCIQLVPGERKIIFRSEPSKNLPWL